MAKEKQMIKRLTFSEDEVDQTLLATAEAKVTAGDFASFNDLCKAALQALLSPAAPSPHPTKAPDVVTESLHVLQTAQQALQTEVRQLADTLTAELRILQKQAAPVNDVSAPVVTQPKPANELAVSQATVNQLARFLEEF